MGPQALGQLHSGRSMKIRNTTPQARRLLLHPSPIHALIVAILAGWQTNMLASQVDRPDLSKAPSLIDFDPELMHGGAVTDLTRFMRGNVTDPGMYNPEIYVNGQWIGRSDIHFTPEPGHADAQPCFDLPLLRRTGIDMRSLALDTAGSGSSSDCIRLGKAIADASVSFDFSNLRLDLSIPQVVMQRQVLGHVDPAQWDAGVPVGMLGYHFNAYHSRTGPQASSMQGYLGLNSGLNFGRWYFRHNGSFSWDSQGPQRYQNISAYALRDLSDWSSQLVIGDTYTDGDLADSVSFRGIRLQTDDRMLPESQRGYAPVVRGVANSNARVTIHQGGVKLYETTVAPGAFVIDDLFPTGYGGDLQVRITESDGTVRSFTVPYAAVPRSLREGRHRYSLTAGLLRGQPGSAPFFSQATWQYGVSNMLTAYGGATAAPGYLSPTAGAVLNTSLGAFGLDLTHSSTRLPNAQTYSGQSLRASYAKGFAESGTHIALAAYRYSTQGFFSLSDAMLARSQAMAGRSDSGFFRPRSRTSLTLSQRLGQQGGNIGVTALIARYWHRPGTDLNYTVGYSNSWGRIPYRLSASRQRDAWGRSSTMVHLGLSIPLGRERPTLLASSLSYDSAGRSQAQASASGLLGGSNRLFYGLNADYRNGDGGGGAHGSANLTYRGPLAQLSGSISAGRGTQQFSLGAQGALVAHSGGVTLSQPLGETFGIVEAKHAQGAKITNTSGVEVDSRGYAIVPYLTPFKMNQVSLDPLGLPAEVELHETSQHVAPLAGAVPLLVFKTSYSRSALVRAKHEDGSPIPFGAVVSDMEGKDLGFVGQSGKLLLRGLDEQGQLQVHWKTPAGPAGCSLSYALPAKQAGSDPQTLPSLELPCVASAASKPQPMAKALPLELSAVVARETPVPEKASERHLDGLRLSTRISVLIVADRMAAGLGARSSGAAMPAPRPKSEPAHHARELKIDRNLAELMPMLVSQASHRHGT